MSNGPALTPNASGDAEAGPALNAPPLSAQLRRQQTLGLRLGEEQDVVEPARALAVPGLTAMDREQLTAWAAPVIEQLLTGPAPG